MTHDQIRKNVVRSTLSGYVRLLLRMVLGLVTFRLLYQSLSPEEFGFWSLLWALFGYGILLDFGFGFTAQKRVAELSVRRDWTTLSRVLSSILGFYLLSAFVACIVGVACSGYLVDLLGVSALHRESFQFTLKIFLVGLGIAFPLGLFPEVLQGQQRITTANNIGIISMLANFVAVLAAVWFKLGLDWLVVLALLAVLLPYLLATWLALRHMPEVLIRPRFVCRSALHESLRFSLYAYLNTLSNVLRHKADAPILGGILGVAHIAPYQAGGKVGEMFGMLTRQIADVLSPTAAHLHAHGDTAALRRMLLDGLRFSVLAATPLFVLTAACMDGLIRVLTGVDTPTPAMFWNGQVLLLWYYSQTLTHWVFKRIFLMAGQEQRMMWQGVSEALVGLVLSILLTLWLRSILGVAIGALVTALIFGWGQLWGWAAREAGLSRTALFARVILPAWTGCLPMIAAAFALRLQPWWNLQSTLLSFLIEGVILGLLGIAGIWRFSLAPAERARISSRRSHRNP
jgi:O-antigen/teichoic acid export membrane protein